MDVLHVTEGDPRTGESSRDRTDIERRREHIIVDNSRNELRQITAQHHDRYHQHAEDEFGLIIIP